MREAIRRSSITIIVLFVRGICSVLLGRWCNGEALGRHIGKFLRWVKKVMSSENLTRFRIESGMKRS